MKILILAPQPFFQHRGTPIAVKLLAEVLAGEGHQVTVLAYHEGDDVEISNVRVCRIPSLPGLKGIKPGPSWKKFVCDALMLWSCLKMTRKTKFDLIHAVEESAFIAIAIRVLFGIPFVYDMDSSLAHQLADKYRMLSPLKRILESFEKMAVQTSLGVVAVCKSLEKTAIDVNPNKLILRLEDISLLDSANEMGDPLRATLKIKGPIVMYVGNLEKYQGVNLLLESFKLATEKMGGAELVIIGGSDDDISRYEARSQELGLSGKTHFVGQRPITQLGFYLEQADILVSPRLQGENTPMKIYSYLDSNKPVLATRLATHTQVLDDQIALLVEAEPEAMAKGLITLLENPDLASDLASRAKERVEMEFSYSAYQYKLVTFYKSLESIMASNEFANGGGIT